MRDSRGMRKTLQSHRIRRSWRRRARGGDAACATLDTSAMHGRVARWSVEHGEDAEGRLFAYVTELVFCGRPVEIAAHRCADAWHMGVEHRSAHTRADRAIALM